MTLLPAPSRAADEALQAVVRDLIGADGVRCSSLPRLVLGHPRPAAALGRGADREAVEALAARAGDPRFWTAGEERGLWRVGTEVDDSGWLVERLMPPDRPETTLRRPESDDQPPTRP